MNILIRTCFAPKYFGANTSSLIPLSTFHEEGRGWKGRGKRTPSDVLCKRGVRSFGWNLQVLSPSLPFATGVSFLHFASTLLFCQSLFFIPIPPFPPFIFVVVDPLKNRSRYEQIVSATYGTPRSLARDFANLPVSRENSGQMEKEEDTKGRKDCLSYSSHMWLAVYTGLHDHLFLLSFRSALFSFALAISLSFSVSFDCAYENFWLQESRPVTLSSLLRSIF